MMDHNMTKEESYADRRQLFKDIWDTAMQIDDEKDTEIMNKPKVIKTLRLDEVDRCVMGKKKKQRIKNLRTVCNKILDFCDRQDADDMFYEQMAIDGRQSPVHNVENKIKKNKNNRTKKKVWRAKSMNSPVRDPSQPRATTSERKEHLLNDMSKKHSRNTSPIKIRQTSLLKKYILVDRTVKRKTSKKNPPISDNLATEPISSRRRVVRKKRSKRKKPSEPGMKNLTLEEHKNGQTHTTIT